MALAIADGVTSYFYEAPPSGTRCWHKENGVIPKSLTVKRGDTLSEIAEQFGLTVTELKSINGLQGSTIQDWSGA